MSFPNPTPFILTLLILSLSFCGFLIHEVNGLRDENTYLKNNQIIINTVQTLMAEDIKPCDL